MMTLEAGHGINRFNSTILVITWKYVYTYEQTTKFPLQNVLRANKRMYPRNIGNVSVSFPHLPSLSFHYFAKTSSSSRRRRKRSISRACGFGFETIFTGKRDDVEIQVIHRRKWSRHVRLPILFGNLWARSDVYDICEVITDLHCTQVALIGVRSRWLMQQGSL